MARANYCEFFRFDDHYSDVFIEGPDCYLYVCAEYGNYCGRHLLAPISYDAGMARKGGITMYYATHTVHDPYYNDGPQVFAFETRAAS